MSAPLLLTVAQAAVLAGIGRGAAYRLCQLGEQHGGWRTVRYGTQYRIPRAWLEEWGARLADGTQIETRDVRYG